MKKALEFSASSIFYILASNVWTKVLSMRTLFAPVSFSFIQYQDKGK